MLSSVDLPLPDGPSSTTSSPREEVEVDAAQRVHVDLAHLVDLGQRRAPRRPAAASSRAAPRPRLDEPAEHVEDAERNRFHRPPPAGHRRGRRSSGRRLRRRPPPSRAAADRDVGADDADRLAARDERAEPAMGARELFGDEPAERPSTAAARNQLADRGQPGPLVRLLEHLGVQAEEHGPERVGVEQRRGRLGVRHQHLPSLQHHGGEQVGLVVEVVVGGALGDAGRGDDAVQGGVLEPA